MSRTSSPVQSSVGMPYQEFDLTPIRPLGAGERLFWLIDQHRPNHFSMAMQVSGSTTPEQWRSALNQAQARHALLSVCICCSADGVPEFHARPDDTIPLRVRRGDIGAWVGEMENQMALQFHPEQSPLARAVLLHEPHAAVLVLTLHHSIADGVSSVYLIRDIMQALLRQELVALPVPESQDAWLARIPAPPVSDPSEDAGNSHWPVGEFCEEREPKPTISIRQMTPELSLALRQRARHEKTSVHGALLAALLAAGRECSEKWREGAVRIASPISSRPWLGIGEDCGLYIGASASIFDPHSPKDFWSLARDARKQLEPSLSRAAFQRFGAKIAEIVPYLDLAGAAQLVLTAFGRDALLTNVGETPYDADFGQLKLDAIWGPSGMTGQKGDHSVGVASVRGQGICLMYSSFSPYPRLLERMEAILTAACQKSS